MVIVGIDPGLKGALVAIESGRKVLFSHPMPLIGGKEIDLAEVRALLVSAKERAERLQVPVTVVLEKVRSRPGQGVVSMFTFGRGLGMIEGLVAGLSMPIQQVTPQAWVKELHEGIDQKLSAKARSMLVVRRLYPDLNLLATPRSKKLHDGLIDAALIATYGLRKLKGGLDESKYYRKDKKDRSW